jgi:hypothetical protein
MARGRRLLLVPKVIVRIVPELDPEEYYQHYILEQLQEDEIRAGTELVHLLRDGRPRVTKKDLMRKYGRGKRVIVEQTRRHPSLLRRYRQDKTEASHPLEHEEIAEVVGGGDPDWDRLLLDVTQIVAGREGAGAYEQAIEALLTALLYPNLVNPIFQHEIHDGRKRIDITYTNAARSGFFEWVAKHHPASHVFVECKNYRGDPANPELDQMVGRFSPSRGKIGLLVCRTIGNKDLFLKRCHDSAQDDHGWIIPLDDSDLTALVEERKHASVIGFGLLKARFERLVM